MPTAMLAASPAQQRFQRPTITTAVATHLLVFLKIWFSKMELKRKILMVHPTPYLCIHG
jgi:hypothetical protein